MIVLQLPASDAGNVSHSPFTSVSCLEPVINLIEPDDLRSLARSAGLVEAQATTETLESGKQFYLARYVLAR